MKENKTKIIATIGPATASKEMLRKILLAGVNVCRINLSHGSHEDLDKIINSIYELNDELNLHTAILADLQGPKLRIGEVQNGHIHLEEGKDIVLTTLACTGTPEKISITYKQLPSDVRVGEKVLIDDGKIVLRIEEVCNDEEVRTKIVQGGELSSKKGLNLPNTKISLPSLTEKDLLDLNFALRHNIPWIGLSFVRSAKDIIELKELIAKSGKLAKVVAKIEKPEAVSDFDAIVKVTDAVMVARGDLGVEVPMEDVPLIQKELVKKSMNNAKPVIIATQLMESMIENISPLRAEVNDVTNAVMDGADAVMLSGETSVGKHPVEVIETIYRIIIKAETYEGIYHRPHTYNFSGERLISDAICETACILAQHVNAKGINTMSFSGYAAFKISSYRPNAHIFIFTSNLRILNMLNLIWGVKGFYYDKFVSTDHTISDIKFVLRKSGKLREGDLVINIASMPIVDKGMSNMIKLSYI